MAIEKLDGGRIVECFETVLDEIDVDFDVPEKFEELTGQTVDDIGKPARQTLFMAATLTK